MKKGRPTNCLNRNSPATRLLQALEDKKGFMPMRDWRELTQAEIAVKESRAQTLTRMQDRGLITVVVELTPAGAAALEQVKERDRG